FYGSPTLSPARRRLRGTLAVGLLLIPAVALAMAITRLPCVSDVAAALLLYLALGHHSLHEHARPIAAALHAGNLDAARGRLGHIVSRDTATLNTTDIAKGAVESVLENGNDAVFAALFWFVIGGAPAVVAYRLANTLDAMWGYRNARYLHFGWAAARLDDLLNYLPARLTALTYALIGDAPRALRCWRAQGVTWKSPNAGPVMAAGAGSLCVQLGGPAVYCGQREERPLLGAGAPPEADDIERALGLVRRGVGLWLVAIGIGGYALG
ncbi:MAG: adenosylcobinamide-phosphate synthase CbiB, partial [Gammaproteobacteria bacterium]